MIRLLKVKLNSKVIWYFSFVNKKSGNQEGLKIPLIRKKKVKVCFLGWSI
jgi:hypothetical protein